MGVRFVVWVLYLVSFSAVKCDGNNGVHYDNEDSGTFHGTDSNDAFYQMNRVPQVFLTVPEDPFGDYTPFFYVPFSPDLDPQNSEAYGYKKLGPNRKKRSINKRSTDDDVQKKYDDDVLVPIKDLDSVKTIHFSSLFTPRFGKKRNSPEPSNKYFIGNGKPYVPSDISSLNVADPVHDSDSGKTIQFSSLFTPRFGRKRRNSPVTVNNFPGNGKPHDASSLFEIFKGPAAVYLEPNNGFRSGGYGIRSKSYHKKQLTPRLGRSSEQNKVQLAAGSAFTPRLGKSENPLLTAGSSFTPRFGRSDNLHLSAGSSFTPRFGRSENNRLTAGSSFTPRFGRSENTQLTAGSSFTPRFGRSENAQLTAGSSFTPRFGRSDEGSQIHFNAGSAFTPRFGRSEYLEQSNQGEAFDDSRWNRMR